MSINSFIKRWHWRWSHVVLSFMFIAALALKWQASQMPDYITILAPVMPSPNARYYYTEAEGISVDPDAIDCSVSSQIDPGGDYKGGHVHLKWIPHNRLLTLPEKDRLLAANSATFAMLHKGMAVTYLARPVRSIKDMFAISYVYDRRMARMLYFEGRTREAEGRWGEAMDAYLDTMKFGSDLARGSPLLGELTGISCQEIGRVRFAGIVEHLSARDAKRGARRLEMIANDEVPYDQVLEQEKWLGLGVLRQMFQSDSWRRQAVVNYYATPSLTSTLKVVLGFAIESPRTGYRCYIRRMDAEIAASRKPWPFSETNSGDVPTDAISTNMLTTMHDARLRVLTELALDRLLDTQLALQAFKLHHAAYPSRLSQLVPNFLSAVPEDPFTNHQQLGYQGTGNTYVLYSVGPDVTENDNSLIMASDVRQ